MTLIRTILISLLTIGVIGTAYWGYQEHLEKNALLINAENNYQRAFHNLTYQIDMLHDQIGETLAMNSRTSISPALVEVWRTTSDAHHSVGQLPLTLLPFNKTEEFLSQIGDFSFQTAVRDLDDEPLSAQEYEHLQLLYDQAAHIQNELRNVQHLVLQDNLRWMDVELALASGDEVTDNTIINGFKTVEKTVEGYDGTDMGTTFLNIKQTDESFKNITGKNITKDEAINIAKKYTNGTKFADVQVSENKKGANYKFYNVSFINEATDDFASMDITKRGGYPIWLIINRNVDETKLDLNKANERAQQFLRENDFNNLHLYDSVQYDNVGLFTYVTKQDDVWVYPDSIKVKVALDNGDIIGFTADKYLQGDLNRSIPTPKITVEAASSQINPNVKIMENRQAVVVGDKGEEVYCYEFLGTLGDDTYRIFINALTGQEEKVEKLRNAEPIYENIV